MSKDDKTALKELYEKDQRTQPGYTTNRSGGSDHFPVFEATVVTEDGDFGLGVGHSKTEAEKDAARQVLIKKGQK